MTRVLILGTVPPGGGPRAEALRRLAADHLAMGDHVEIWSPSARSAAHVHARRTGLGLLRPLLAASGRFDTLVLRFETGMPFRGNETRAARAAFFLLLGAVLRRFDQVTVILDSPICIPGGVGGRPTKELWSRAEVLIEDEDDREHLRAVPWLDQARIALAELPPELPSAAVPQWPKPDTPELRSAVLEVVRQRAVAGRRLQQAGFDLVLAKSAEEAVRGAPRRRHPDLVAALEVTRDAGRVQRFRRLRRSALARRVGRKLPLRVRRALLR